MAAPRRAERYAELVKEEINKIIIHEIDDFSDFFITITRVDMASTLKDVTIFYSVLGDDTAIRKVHDLFKKHAAHIRFEMGNRIPFRFVPQFRFSYDTTIEHASRIENILRNLE
jgi:ribosome-binding factor A